MILFPLLIITGVVFVTLKVAAVVAWSWWLVLMPFGFALFLVLAIAILQYLIMAAVWRHWN